MTRFHLLLLMSITLTSSALLAQSTVKGTLVDSLNQDKLFYVSVGIVTTDSTMQEMGVAYTEADGSFSISGVPSGSYLLRASYLGYETLDIPITARYNSWVTSHCPI